MGTVNALKEYDIQVDSLNGGTVDMGDGLEFNSLRAQMWWCMREDLRLEKIILPNDPELFADLVTPRFEIRLSKICIEDKQALKKRLGRSPDKGDSAVYWNWQRQDVRFVVLFEA